MPSRTVYDTYIRDLTREDVERLFTRDTREAYRFFARGLDVEKLAALPWHKRVLVHARFVFLAFTLKLSPARRALYGVALVMMLLGLIELFRDVAPASIPTPLVTLLIPVPRWHEGTGWMLLAFLLTNLLVLLEVADRLSLKNELEIARDIQQAMLPTGTWSKGDLAVSGMTRPANTVGGDFYDILPLPDGRLIVTVGDVAGKGSPAALLMALLLAMLRTLVDEGLEAAALMERLNVQIARHAPPSRFITLFYGLYEPITGTLTYVNAGHTPPLLRRAHSSFERLPGTGVALGMFAGSRYEAATTVILPGDLLVLYSDGITEAESPEGQPFEEAGLEREIERGATDPPAALGAAIFRAVERHAQDSKLGDDLTILILQRRTLVA